MKLEVFVTKTLNGELEGLTNEEAFALIEETRKESGLSNKDFIYLISDLINKL